MQSQSESENERFMNPQYKGPSIRSPGLPDSPDPPDPLDPPGPLGPGPSTSSTFIPKKKFPVALTDPQVNKIIQSLETTTTLNQKEAYEDYSEAFNHFVGFANNFTHIFNVYKSWSNRLPQFPPSLIQIHQLIEVAIRFGVSLKEIIYELTPKSSRQIYFNNDLSMNNATNYVNAAAGNSNVIMVRASNETILLLVKACARIQIDDETRVVLKWIIAGGGGFTSQIALDTSLFNDMLREFSSAGDLYGSMLLYQYMEEYSNGALSSSCDLDTFTLLASVFARGCQSDGLFAVFELMRAKQIFPNVQMLEKLCEDSLGALSKPNILLHRSNNTTLVDPTPRLDLCRKIIAVCNDPEGILRQMEIPGATSSMYQQLIKACRRSQLYEDAFEAYKEMRLNYPSYFLPADEFNYFVREACQKLNIQAGIAMVQNLYASPSQEAKSTEDITNSAKDDISPINLLLDICLKQSCDLSIVGSIVSIIENYKINCNSTTHNSLIHIFAQLGYYQSSVEQYKFMILSSPPNIETFNGLLLAARTNSNLQLSDLEYLLTEMFEYKIIPDLTTFRLLLRLLSNFQELKPFFIASFQSLILLLNQSACLPSSDPSPSPLPNNNVKTFYFNRTTPISFMNLESAFLQFISEGRANINYDVKSQAEPSLSEASSPDMKVNPLTTPALGSTSNIFTIISEWLEACVKLNDCDNYELMRSFFHLIKTLKIPVHAEVMKNIFLTLSSIHPTYSGTLRPFALFILKFTRENNQNNSWEIFLQGLTNFNSLLIQDIGTTINDYWNPLILQDPQNFQFKVDDYHLVARILLKSNIVYINDWLEALNTEKVPFPPNIRESLLSDQIQIPSPPVLLRAWTIMSNTSESPGPRTEEEVYVEDSGSNALPSSPEFYLPLIQHFETQKFHRALHEVLLLMKSHRVPLNRSIIKISLKIYASNIEKARLDQVELIFQGIINHSKLSTASFISELIHFLIDLRSKGSLWVIKQLFKMIPVDRNDLILAFPPSILLQFLQHSQMEYKLQTSGKSSGMNTDRPVAAIRHDLDFIFLQLTKHLPSMPSDLVRVCLSKISGGAGELGVSFSCRWVMCYFSHLRSLPLSEGGSLFLNSLLLQLFQTFEGDPLPLRQSIVKELRQILLNMFTLPILPSNEIWSYFIKFSLLDDSRSNLPESIYTAALESCLFIQQHALNKSIGEAKLHYPRFYSTNQEYMNSLLQRSDELMASCSHPDIASSLLTFLKDSEDFHRNTNRNNNDDESKYNNNNFDSSIRFLQWIQSFGNVFNFNFPFRLLV